MRPRSRSWILVCMLAVGCEPETPPAPPPAPKAAPGQPDAAAEATFEPGTTPAVLTFAADRGAFQDTSKPEDVPEGSRGMVRVTLVGGTDPPPGQVWVANLDTPLAEGGFKLTTVERDLFEELALGQGHKSEVQLPEGLTPPPQTPATAAGQVIVYKTAWCGVCKKVEAYLKRKGVDYVAKDIEKDRDAAAELQAKASTKGVKTGSVPVIDIGGELIVGFNRARMEKLLAG